MSWTSLAGCSCSSHQSYSFPPYLLRGPALCLYFKQHIAEQSVLKDASDADCFLIISPFPCFDVIDLFVVGFCLLVVVFSDGTLLECA